MSQVHVLAVMKSFMCFHKILRERLDLWQGNRFERPLESVFSTSYRVAPLDETISNNMMP